jgi:hypothetical protein
VTYTGADATALAAWCASVSDALSHKLRPFLAEPQTLTFYCDAPASDILILPVRPIRALTSLYLNPAANGVSTNFTSADLLTPGVDYYMPLDPIDSISRSGMVYRRGGGWYSGGFAWGYENVPRAGLLGSKMDSNKGAIKVVADCGTASVPTAITAAAVMAVSLLMNRRKTGAALSNESWGGYSYGYAGPLIRRIVSSYFARISLSLCREPCRYSIAHRGRHSAWLSTTRPVARMPAVVRR